MIGGERQLVAGIVAQFKQAAAIAGFFGGDRSQNVALIDIHAAIKRVDRSLKFLLRFDAAYTFVGEQHFECIDAPVQVRAKGAETPVEPQLPIAA